MPETSFPISLSFLPGVFHGKEKKIRSVVEAETHLAWRQCRIVHEVIIILRQRRLSRLLFFLQHWIIPFSSRLDLCLALWDVDGTQRVSQSPWGCFSSLTHSAWPADADATIFRYLVASGTSSSQSPIPHSSRAFSFEISVASGYFFFHVKLYWQFHHWRSRNRTGNISKTDDRWRLSSTVRRLLLSYRGLRVLRWRRMRSDETEEALARSRNGFQEKSFTRSKLQSSRARVSSSRRSHTTVAASG